MIRTYLVVSLSYVTISLFILNDHSNPVKTHSGRTWEYLLEPGQSGSPDFVRTLQKSVAHPDLFLGWSGDGLSRSEVSWTYLGLPGSIWLFLFLSGTSVQRQIQFISGSFLGLSGSIWYYLVVIGLVWNHITNNKDLRRTVNIRIFLTEEQRTSEVEKHLRSHRGDVTLSRSASILFFSLESSS